MTKNFEMYYSLLNILEGKKITKEYLRYIAITVRVDFAHGAWFSLPIFRRILYNAQAIDPEVTNPKIPGDCEYFLERFGKFFPR